MTTPKINGKELEAFMSTLDTSVFEKGKWDWTGEATVVVVMYKTEMTDEVDEFLGSSVADSHMVRVIDLYDLHEQLRIPFDDTYNKIVAFIVSEWLKDNKNVVLAVDKDCIMGSEAMVDFIKVVAAQYKVSVQMLKVRK